MNSSQGPEEGFRNTLLGTWELKSPYWLGDCVNG